ncbi:MAG: GNAT family N-acetyltransferase [candidate division Zixibacteria bacterium]|nr:GNAT family N-acetyltransferase [candidate division Zixibacteria bacterium]
MLLTSDLTVHSLPIMSWQRRHPSEIPRDQWLGWLAQSPGVSPYLLPEWGLFWESVWPGSRAELWSRTGANGQITMAIPLVRRKRFGCEFCHAQPYGTPALLCPSGGDTEAGRELLDRTLGPRVVELAATPDWTGGRGPGWHHSTLTQRSWIIDLSHAEGAALESLFSGSHRRNIAKGRELSLRITSPANEFEVGRLPDTWSDWSRPQRFILKRHYASTLFRLFAPTGALCWRVAWVGDHPVSAVVFLIHGGVAVSLDTIVDREPKYRGAGHVLLADTLTHLRNEGVRTVDLGGVPGGAGNEGLQEFKSGWGATPRESMTGVHRRAWYHATRRLLGRR